MSSLQVLEITDVNRSQMRVEFDGSEIWMSIDLASGFRAIQIDASDRGRFQAFLNASRVEGRS